MSSLKVNTQVEINNIIKKKRKDSLLVNTLELFVLRDKNFKNVRNKNFYSAQYIISILTGFISIGGIILFIYLLSNEDNEIGIMGLFCSLIIASTFYFLLRRSKKALEYYKHGFKLTNSYFVQRGATEYQGKFALEIIMLTIMVSLLVISESKGIYNYNLPLFLWTVSIFLKVTYTAGMIIGLKNPAMLRNYRYSAIIDKIFHYGNLLLIVAFFSILISFIAKPRPIDINLIYLVLFILIYKVVKATRKQLLINEIKAGKFNRSYTEFIIFCDEDKIVNEFADEYKKHERKITNNGEISISDEKIEDAWIKSKMDEKSSYTPYVMLLFVNSITMLITEAAKEYGYKKVLKPWLETILENPNYIINIVVFIVSILALILINKFKK